MDVAGPSVSPGAATKRRRRDLNVEVLWVSEVYGRERRGAVCMIDPLMAAFKNRG